MPSRIIAANEFSGNQGTLEQAAEQHYSVMPINQPLDNPNAEEQQEGIILPLDNRPIRFTMPEPKQKPRQLNRLVGANGVCGSWVYGLDFEAHGTLAITNAATTKQAITAPAYTQIRNDLWPDPVGSYLCVRLFSIAPTTSGAVGDLQCFFADQTGRMVPLGDYNPGTGGTSPDMHLLCPSPITDVGLKAVGTLVVIWNGGAAGITVGYSLGFSLAYLLPSYQPYEDGASCGGY